MLFVNFMAYMFDGFCCVLKIFKSPWKVLNMFFSYLIKLGLVQSYANYFFVQLPLTQIVFRCSNRLYAEELLLFPCLEVPSSRKSFQRRHLLLLSRVSLLLGVFLDEWRLSFPRKNVKPAEKKATNTFLGKFDLFE